MFIIAFQQESQSHYTVRYLTSTRPNPEHKSVLSCGSTLMSSVINAPTPLLQSLVMKFVPDNTDPKSELRFSYLGISLIAR